MDKSKEELIEQLNELKLLLFIEQNNADNFCGISQLEIADKISEIEKQLQEIGD